MVNVSYLEDSDLNPDGSLKPHVNNGRPCVVMVQGAFCGYCTKAKPDYQKLAHRSQKVAIVTVQIDGGPSEKSAGTMLTKVDKSYRGVPHYMGFNSQGKYVRTHTGGRDMASLEQFANSL